MSVRAAALSACTLVRPVSRALQRRLPTARVAVLPRPFGRLPQQWARLSSLPPVPSSTARFVRRAMTIAVASATPAVAPPREKFRKDYARLPVFVDQVIDGADGAEGFSCVP